MKTFLPLISILIFTLSCSSDKNDSGKIYSLATLQENTLQQYYFGEEKRATLHEYFQDKSGGDRFHSRIFKLCQSASSIDSCAGNVISVLEAIKAELFKQSGEEMNLTKSSSILRVTYDKQDPTHPWIYDFTKVKHTGGSSILHAENRQKIVASIRRYRKQICELIEKSNNDSYSSKPYFFKDPNINDFKDQDDLTKQFDKALKQLNVSPDDVETIRRIYQTLSKTDEEWEAIMGKKDSWIDAVSVLLSIENSVFQARSFALNIVGARIGCGGSYNFTNILPLVNGPSAALAGDTVELQVLMAAFNGDRNPVISLSGGKVTRIENGIGYVQIVVPKSGELKVAGKISIMNKSGVPKTIDWSYGIKAVSLK